MDFLQQLQEQIKNIWQNFNNTQKTVIVGGSLAVFVLLIASAFMLGKTSYESLYPNLDINDSAMIAAKLKDMNVDYKLGEDGTTILVPATAKHQLRLELANELPQGGVIGFESFDKARFGETDTDKRVRYLAALQGELTRTIQEMAEVETAKVHIVLPEPALFVSETKPATASVLLKLKPYANMNMQKVRSIVYFLSHSIEGLNPDNVTVIDIYGNLLSEGIMDGANSELSTSQLTATQIDVKKRFEENLAKSLQTMLEKVMGSGKAVVRTSVEMDFDQIETSTEDYGDKVIRSEELKEETTEGTTENQGGIPGAESNLPETTSYQSGANKNTSSSESSQTIRNYEIDKFVENRKKAPGQIQRLSVAVIIDGELSAEQESDIENIVAKAAGVNDDRGDTISITSMPFNTDSYNRLQEQIEEEASRQRMVELVKYGLLGLGGLIIALFMFLLIRRNMARMAKQSMLNQPQTVANYEEMLGQLAPENREKAQVQKRIEKIAKTQPDNVAKVIRTWLAEDTR